MGRWALEVEYMVTHLDDLTRDEFAERVKEGTLVILPIGAVEEHGPHLPLCTDSIQAENLAIRLSERFNALVAPPIRYGECMTVKNFPGTITLTFDTTRALAREIVAELARNGIRRVLVLSGHAGRAHMTALREAGKAVVAQYKDLRLLVLSDYELAYGLLGSEFDADDGHAGTIETSRVMQIRGDLVKELPERSVPKPSLYRVVDDPERFFPTGYWGDPTKATKEQGQKVEDYVFDELVKMIDEHLMR